ncbi:MAG: hypothetical protein M3416_00505 [Acidobacteriota bacterium]|nr:hypothetical protein [Acidobacteriota bacterium]
MPGLRIILDKSVIRGLNNSEADSLDRYFFQIVPPALINEILADLTKEDREPKIINMIAGQSYRISGNRGITEDYRRVLASSLMGYEIPMEGKFLAAGERTVRSETGSVGTVAETTLEDKTILRWERKQFTRKEKERASRFRGRSQRPLKPEMYLGKIKEAGLEFAIPNTDEELVEAVDSLLRERRFQARLFPLLSREHGIPPGSQALVIKRWFKEGRPMFKDFAPYAFFCLRANFLWALGLTNRKLFKPDKNDRKDLEYCYYLPHCEMFASRDDKHKRLVPFLLRPDQSFIDGDELKKDLRRLSEMWEAMGPEDRIRTSAERGGAPPEDENSLVFRLWGKHRGEVVKSLPLEILDMKIVDSRKPPGERVPITFRDFLLTKAKQIRASTEVPGGELERIREDAKGADPRTWAMMKTTMSRERILKMYPGLSEEDLDKAGTD